MIRIMQSKAATVDQYLVELPDDRRAALQQVREVILKNLDADYEEGMQYGMIGYYVPHRVYPAGYHCDPRQPLPFAALGSQKNHMSLHLMCIYGDSEQAQRFQAAWRRTGKKLDMGRACIRFKRIEDVPLEVIGEAIRRVPVKAYIALMETALQGNRRRATERAAQRKSSGGERTLRKAGRTAAKTASARKSKRGAPRRTQRSSPRAAPRRRTRR